MRGQARRWTAFGATSLLAFAALVGCGTSGHTYKLFAGCTPLKAGAPVRVLDQRRGTVDDVRLGVRTGSGAALIVTMTVDQQAGQLHTDGRAVIRDDGIDLSLGSPSEPLIPNNGALPRSHVRMAGTCP